MKNKSVKSKNDYKSIANQINNVKSNNNKSTKSIKKEKLEKKEKVEVENSAFVMVPINHPKINEIMKILNESEESNKPLLENNENIKSENNFKLIITLNDILTNFSEDKIIIPENSIISPLAKDYIKQKKIEIVYTKN